MVGEGWDGWSERESPSLPEGPQPAAGDCGLRLPDDLPEARPDGPEPALDRVLRGRTSRPRASSFPRELVDDRVGRHEAPSPGPDHDRVEVDARIPVPALC